jgi:hypothetical protein
VLHRRGLSVNPGQVFGWTGAITGNLRQPPFSSDRRTQSASHTRSSKPEVVTAAMATRTAMIRSFNTSLAV